MTIYKLFIRPHLNYGDILYDQMFNNSFHERLESIQYNAALAITGFRRSSSKVGDFPILNSGYKHKCKRKILQALFIKSNRPNLNKQGTSVPLKPFN